MARFDALVARAPSEPLVVCAEGTLGRREVARLAESAQRCASAAGWGEGDLVGLNAPNGPGFLAGWVALRRLGCAVLLLDRATASDGRGQVLAAMGAKGSLVYRREPGTFIADRVASVPSRHPRRFDPSVSVVKMTSGSTGSPEGILVTSEALIADDRALASSMELLEDERILAAVPLSHSYGFSSVALPALRRGSVVVVPDDAGPLAPVRAVDRHRVTFLPTTPAYLSALVQLREPPPLGAAIRRVIAAGAPLHRQTARRFREAYDRGVHVFYGASECGGIAYDREGTAAERGTVGTPVDGVEIAIDRSDAGTSDNGHLQGEDRAGVITVRSRAVACGYFPTPSERLGSGRFVSSDLGRWCEGELRLVGRRDDLINVRGRKVNPREVESVLRALPSVVDAAVLGVPRPNGGGETVGAVVARGENRVAEGELRAHCRLRLADHKVPRVFLVLDALPRSPRGKIDRASARTLLAAAVEE